MLKKTDAPVDELEDCYLLVQKNTIPQFFEKLLCPECKQPGLSFTTSSAGKCGFLMKAKVICENCENLVKEDYLCERVGGSTSQTVPFDINLKPVFHEAEFFARTPDSARTFFLGMRKSKKYCALEL